MQLHYGIRLGLIALAGIALAGAAWGSLDNEIVRNVLTMIGGLLGGLGLAGGPSKAAKGIVLVALVAGAQACAPCLAEQSVVSALGVGLQAADDAVGDSGGDEWSRTLELAEGTHLLGVAAVDACELARDSAGWQAWVGLALETAGAVAAFFGAADEPGRPSDPPQELTSAIDMLNGELK